MIKKMAVAAIALGVITAIPSPAFAQQADRGFKELPRDTREKSAVQRLQERAADTFGDCVVRREPVDARAYINLDASPEAISPALSTVISKCMPARWHPTHEFVEQETAVAITRAVARKNEMARVN